MTSQDDPVVKADSVTKDAARKRLPPETVDGSAAFVKAKRKARKLKTEKGLRSCDPTNGEDRKRVYDETKMSAPEIRKELARRYLEIDRILEDCRHLQTLLQSRENGFGIAGSAQADLSAAEGTDAVDETAANARVENRLASDDLTDFENIPCVDASPHYRLISPRESGQEKIAGQSSKDRSERNDLSHERDSQNKFFDVDFDFFDEEDLRPPSPFKQVSPPPNLPVEEKREQQVKTVDEIAQVDANGGVEGIGTFVKDAEAGTDDPENLELFRELQALRLAKILDEQKRMLNTAVAACTNPPVAEQMAAPMAEAEAETEVMDENWVAAADDRGGKTEESKVLPGFMEIEWKICKDKEMIKILCDHFGILHTLPLNKMRRLLDIIQHEFQRALDDEPRWPCH